MPCTVRCRAPPDSLNLEPRMRLKRILLPALCLAATALMAIPLAHAASDHFGLDTAAGGAGLKNLDLPTTIGVLIKSVLSFLGILFLVLTLYAGFLYMTAQGDEKKVAKAKSIVTGAVIGLVIIAASYAITSFVLGAITGTASTSNTSNTSNTSTIGTVQKGGACTSGSDCAAGLICDIGGSNTCI